MNVLLCVEEKRFNEPAMAAWKSFVAGVSSIPFDCSTSAPNVEVAPLDLAPGATATADFIEGIERPQYAYSFPPMAKFCLAEGFFARPTDRQIPILLHEAVHIRLQQGRLRRNHAAVKHSRNHPNVSLLVDVDRTPKFESMLDRRNLAVELLPFAQEAGVDNFMATNYPKVAAPYFAERERFFSNGEAYRYDDARTPALIRYRVFYRLLRAALGISVYQDSAAQLRLTAILRQTEADLRRVCDDQLFSWFETQRAKLLSVNVRSDEPDEDAYTDVFERVIDLPVP